MKKGLFRRPTNPLEGQSKLDKFITIQSADEIFICCSQCNKKITSTEIEENLNACPYCMYHFKMNARQRLNMICDADTFEETNSELISKNIIEFPTYDIKLKNAKLKSAEKDAVVCGFCKINGEKTAIFVMEPYFMMGSMGAVVGEKITRLFEQATQKNLPVVGFTLSGGARMQEGIVSLMQMAKVSGAVKRHSDNGGFFVCVLCDPTTGGVTASFAMEADIIFAEPFALIGFAGPRVIEQTIRQKLPKGFQRAEFLLEKGFIDNIIDRKRQKKQLGLVLKLHKKEQTL